DRRGTFGRPLLHRAPGVIGGGRPARIALLAAVDDWVMAGTRGVTARRRCARTAWCGRLREPGVFHGRLRAGRRLHRVLRLTAPGRHDSFPAELFARCWLAPS